MKHRGRHAIVTHQLSGLPGYSALAKSGSYAWETDNSIARGNQGGKLLRALRK